MTRHSRVRRDRCVYACAGYDYTFFCALHPDMRPDWAAAWARFLKPGGILKCLIFPVEPERQTGPPWHVDPQIYESLLSKNGGRGAGARVPAARLGRTVRGCQATVVGKPAVA